LLKEYLEYLEDMRAAEWVRYKILAAFECMVDYRRKPMFEEYEVKLAELIPLRRVLDGLPDGLNNENIRDAKKRVNSEINYVLHKIGKVEE